MEKECKTCKVTKKLDDFEKTNTSYRTVCKDCRKLARKTRVAEVEKIDKTSVPLPTACLKCNKGPDDVSFQWRTDTVNGGWRNTCTECFNSKGYSITSRANRRTADEDEYLKRNAATHLDWANRNRDKVRIQQFKTVTDAKRKIKTIKTSATSRNIIFDENDTESMAAKLSLACHYCDYVPPENSILNGLDKVNPYEGYNDANTVSCCAICNAMKGVRTVDAFIANVRAIITYRRVVTSVPRSNIKPFGGRAELRDAPKKEKVDFLTIDDKMSLWSTPCYMCSRSPSFGIDRMDADGDYTLDNSKPCCAECNYAKKDLSIVNFEAHLSTIYSHSAMWILRNIDHEPILTSTKLERIHVKATLINGDKSLIFPSICRASNIVGVCMSAIQKALNNERSCMGCKWETVQPIQYRMQDISHDDALEIIMHIRHSGKRNK